MEATLNLEVICDDCKSQLETMIDNSSSSVRVEVALCKKCRPEPATEVSVDLVINNNMDSKTLLLNIE